jgi:hypothetical protein
MVFEAEMRFFENFAFHLGYESLISVLNKVLGEDRDDRTKITRRIGA